MSASEGVVGFVGLGAMGAPMARRLLGAGLKVMVFDVNQGAVQRLAEEGALAASSLGDLANTASTVLVSLPTPDVVESVATELAASKSLRLYIDLSTTGASAAVRVAEIMQQAGVACVDAPVSGGVAGAANGTLAIMVSGAKSAFDDAGAFLQHLGKKVVHVGETVGQAQIMKLANNMISASTLVAVSEALALCKKAGIAADRAVEIWNAGGARSVITEAVFPRAVLTETYDFGFRMELMNKDVRLCIEESNAMGVPMLHSSNAAQIYGLVVNQGYGAQDLSIMAKVIEDWAGAKKQG